MGDATEGDTGLFFPDSVVAEWALQTHLVEFLASQGIEPSDVDVSWHHDPGWPQGGTFFELKPDR